MVAATWVPWPCGSPAAFSPVKSRWSATLPARSGWAASTPVSSTATVVPVPSYPAAHASGAPICGTLSFSTGSTLRSSQILVTPASGPAARACGDGEASLASSAPNAFASAAATDTPAPPMLSSVRTCLAAGMAALVLLGGYVRMSGMAAP